MLKRVLLPVLFLAAAACATASAQCINQTNGTTSKDLICVTPNVYGASFNRFTGQYLGGITLAPTVPQHFAHFQGDASLRAFSSLSSAIGTQLSLLPLTTPASGVSFTFAGGVVSQTTEGFGPVLGERGETLGRHRVHLGLMYQHFAFDELDGTSLSHIPAVYGHIPLPGFNPATSRWENDVIVTDSRVDLKVDQWTAVAAFGLTNRIDVALAVPILRVQMGVSSNANIVRAPGSVADCLRDFPAITSGQCHSFAGANPDSATYFSPASASGVGDLILRVKGQIYKGERAAIALGGDVRLPTGDEKNFLGAGAAGFRPFLALSYRARVTPHLNVGYEWNGSSILAGAVTSTGTLTEARLPNQLFYILGADVALTKRLSGAVDWVGQRVIGAPRIVPQPVTTTGGLTFQTITPVRESYQMNNASLGLKYSPVKRLVFTANVAMRLDTGGLRAKAVPLIGLGYTF